MMCGAQRPRKFNGSQAIAHYDEQSSGGSNCMARLIHSLAIATGIQLPLPLVAQPIWKLYWYVRRAVQNACAAWCTTDYCAMMPRVSRPLD